MIEGNILELVWGSVELALNGLLYGRLRLPQKTVSQGSALRLSLQIIKDNVYNYNLGVDTKMTRYVVASLLAPDALRHIRNYEHPLHFLYGCFMLFDLLVVMDIFPSNQSETLYAIVFLIRLLRIAEIFCRTAMAAMTIRIKKVIRKPQQPQQPIVSNVKSPSISQPTTKDNSHEGEEVQQKTKKQNKLIYQFKLKTSKTQEFLIMDDPQKFDSLFDQVQLEKRTLLNVKLNYCSQVYLTMKKTSNPDKQTLQSLQKWIATYQSELLLCDM